MVKRDMHVMAGDPFSQHIAPTCDSSHMFTQPRSSRPTADSNDSPVRQVFSFAQKLICHNTAVTTHVTVSSVFKKNINTENSLNDH